MKNESPTGRPSKNIPTEAYKPVSTNDKIIHQQVVNRIVRAQSHPLAGKGDVKTPAPMLDQRPKFWAYATGDGPKQQPDERSTN
jgi:hypothetical protein